MEFIKELIRFLRGLGAPGLMGLAFIDSAGIPTGGAPDWVLLLMVNQSRLLIDSLAFVPAAVFGSVLGCLVPYYLGRKGGALVLDRIGAERREIVRDKINRYGLWAVALSVVAPPPYPMKLFILSAGVFGMPLGKFLLVALMGRTVRYGLVAYLAVRYGEQATELVQGNFASFAVLLVVLALLILVVQRRYKRSGT